MRSFIEQSLHITVFFLEYVINLENFAHHSFQTGSEEIIWTSFIVEQSPHCRLSNTESQNARDNDYRRVDQMAAEGTGAKALLTITCLK
jgi:hypothetical protein